MQKYKSEFNSTLSGTTLGNVQACLRLNDLDSIGDGTHLAYFNMIGTFSFRHWTVPQTIKFWMHFLSKLSIKPDYATVHPDCKDWTKYHELEVRLDPECKWSDGEIGGYCTEFYKDNVEIGNIVNPMGNCIDVGFGLERLDMFVNSPPKRTTEELLQETVSILIDEGYEPGNKKQGYVLRQLLRRLVMLDSPMSHQFYEQEKQRQSQMQERYHKLKSKYPDKDKAWWRSTHGIEL